MSASRFTIAALCLAAVVPTASAQSIISGPVTAANGSRYYLVGNVPNYAAAQAFARALGGELATIDDAAENSLLTSLFAVPGGRKLFIGLNDARLANTFEWVDGSRSTYRNWAVGQPRISIVDNFTQLLPDGEWDTENDTNTPFAVVELTGAVRVPQEILTLNNAINLAGAIDREVVLSPGTYTLLNSTISGDEIVIRGSGRGQTTIVIPNGGPGFNVNNSTLRLEGVTIRLEGNAIPISTLGVSVISMKNVAIEAAPAFTGTGFLNVPGIGVTNLTVDGSDIRIPCDFLLNGNINFNTTVRNSIIRAPRIATGNGSFNANNSTIVASNALPFANNVRTALVNSIFSSSVPADLSRVAARFSILPTFAPGPGNRTSDPRFVNAAAGDYRLRPDSPAIDAGSTESHLLGRPEWLSDAANLPRIVDDARTNNPGAIDIGALEFQGLNSSGCAADFNGDGTLDINDFFAYLAAYAGGC